MVAAAAAAAVAAANHPSWSKLQLLKNIGIKSFPNFKKYSFPSKRRKGIYNRDIIGYE
jgi:hypothetical protein